MALGSAFKAGEDAEQRVSHNWLPSFPSLKSQTSRLESHAIDEDYSPGNDGNVFVSRPGKSGRVRLKEETFRQNLEDNLKPQVMQIPDLDVIMESIHCSLGAMVDLLQSKSLQRVRAARSIQTDGYSEGDAKLSLKMPTGLELNTPAAVAESIMLRTASEINLELSRLLQLRNDGENSERVSEAMRGFVACFTNIGLENARLLERLQVGEELLKLMGVPAQHVPTYELIYALDSHGASIFVKLDVVSGLFVFAQERDLQAPWAPISECVFADCSPRIVDLCRNLEALNSADQACVPALREAVVNANQEMIETGNLRQNEMEASSNVRSALAEMVVLGLIRGLGVTSVLEFQELRSEDRDALMLLMNKTEAETLREALQCREELQTFRMRLVNLIERRDALNPRQYLQQLDTLSEWAKRRPGLLI
jgi:hypothetical protein